MTECPLIKCPLLIGCPLRRECVDSRQKYLAGECPLPCMKAERPKPETGTFTDQRDGREYRTVKIGEQTWMAENLNFDYAGSKAYNSDPAMREKYGLLYDWETAKKACPPGWHLPSDTEWGTLVNFAGGDKIAGKKLKARSGWNSKDGKSGNGTDIYGFSALPGGYGSSDGYFRNAGDSGNWWSSSETDASYAYRRYMYYGYEDAYWDDANEGYLFSVRCLQDCGGMAK